MKKFTLKLLAAAVALAAATGAQAAVEFSNGDGDLFVSLTTGTATTAGNGTAAFDLGFSMSQASTWNGVAGLRLEWNLATGAFTSNNSAIAASNASLGSYGTTLATFQGLSQYNLATAQLSVLAFDSTGAGIIGTAGQNLMSTANIISNLGAPTQPGATFGPTNGNLANTFGNAIVANYVGTMNADPGMAAAVGSNIGLAGANDHYNTGTGMATMGGQSPVDNNGLYGGQYAAGTSVFAGQDKALAFFQFSASSLTSTARTDRIAFGVDLDGDGIIEFDNNGATAGGSNEFALWTMQGDTLVYSNPGVVAAPVPEPSTYAMMLAGLALLGGMARRRLK